ncbi:hypothetical protein ADUPG1_009351 [Aduncisulcus paluster]|uniref:Uncharacterized protein n=1 Tax=Aduncisulcus paluster TaxID=2918883 RepID=A0ABQ5KY58_9EUKA|nr:hypothetical protein ADUPG1_009351 [Aduncisulcus paluster]
MIHQIPSLIVKRSSAIHVSAPISSKSPKFEVYIRGNVLCEYMLCQEETMKNFSAHYHIKDYKLPDEKRRLYCPWNGEDLKCSKIFSASQFDHGKAKTMKFESYSNVLKLSKTYGSYVFQLPYLIEKRMRNEMYNRIEMHSAGVEELFE